MLPLQCLLSVFSSPPHVVFMLGDEIGWNNVQWHSNVTLTPNLEELRRAGVTLNRHYVQRWCAPTRAALLTGRYAYNVGMNDYGGGSAYREERSAVPSSFSMLPRLLKTTGYITHQVGKWHLGYFKRASLPTGRGFDSSFGFLCGASTHDTRGSQTKHTCGLSVTDLYNSSRIANDTAYATNRVYSTFMYAREAARLIEAHDQSRPFFLYMAFQNSHAPYQVPHEYTDLYPALARGKSRRCFNAMVTAVDQSVGTIMDALRKSRMDNNSIVVYSSDNGGPARFANNLPLRGSKFGVFEGGIRVPAFVWSHLLPESARGTSTDALIYISDWFSTIAKLGGVSSNKIQNSGPVPPDGVDIWAAVAGAGEIPQALSPRTSIIHEFDVPGAGNGGINAIRSGKWKLIWGKVGESEWIPDVDYTPGCTKLLPPVNGTEMAITYSSLELAPRIAAENSVGPGSGLSCTVDKPCLFDVEGDESEHNEIAADNPEVVARLKAELAAYTATRYMGGLDHAKTTQQRYCDLIRRAQWVQPYDDGEFPPAPPAPPLPPSVIARFTGKWAQVEENRPPEMMNIDAGTSSELAIHPVNCTGCCWSAATGSIGLDGTGLTVTTTGGCTRHESGKLQTTKSGALQIVWGNWKLWEKVWRSGVL